MKPLSKELEEISLLNKKIDTDIGELEIHNDNFQINNEVDQFDRIKEIKNCIHQKTLSVLTYNLKKLIQLETTQKNLARKIGVSEDLLSKYKGGNSLPPIDTLLYICKIYNLDFNRFISFPFDSSDLDHIESTINMQTSALNLTKLFEKKYFLYFYVTNTEREGAIHEGLLQIISKNHVQFKILAHKLQKGPEMIIKQFEGSYYATSKLIFFDLSNANDGNAHITMMHPNLNMSRYKGGIALLTLPSDANSKPCSQKVLISKQQINRERDYVALCEILNFNVEGSSFGNIKISHEDNEKAYKFIKSRV